MLVLLLFCAFKSGADRYYLKKAAGLRAYGKDVFYYFGYKNIFRLVLFYLSLFTLKLLLLLFSFLPFIICAFTVNHLLNQGSISATLFNMLVIFTAVLFIHGLIFFFRFNSFLFIARYRFATGHPEKMKELFIFSFKCVEGKRREIFYKKLSFLPWVASCVLLLPIGFVRSYYSQSMAELAADLMKKHLQNG